ncbi:hypothetical protein SynBIOSU31_01598 [Synechococcus sp. BIOS-U3-1]|nr:hypothetical protein SynBIOSU31_01598 [Synechococcus sp. BIOS-U3-1]
MIFNIQPCSAECDSRTQTGPIPVSYLHPYELSIQVVDERIAQPPSIATRGKMSRSKKFNTEFLAKSPLI